MLDSQDQLFLPKPVFRKAFLSTNIQTLPSYVSPSCPHPAPPRLAICPQCTYLLNSIEKKKKKSFFLKCHHSNQTDCNDWKLPLSDSSSREESWTPLADWNWLMKKLSCSAADGGCRFWVFSIGSGWFLVGFLRGCFFFFLDLLFGARDFRLYLSSTVTPPLPIFASLFAAALWGLRFNTTFYSGCGWRLDRVWVGPNKCNSYFGKSEFFGLYILGCLFWSQDFKFFQFSPFVFKPVSI